MKKDRDFVDVYNKGWLETGVWQLQNTGFIGASCLASIFDSLHGRCSDWVARCKILISGLEHFFFFLLVRIVLKELYLKISLAPTCLILLTHLGVNLVFVLLQPLFLGHSLYLHHSFLEQNFSVLTNPLYFSYIADF